MPRLLNAFVVTILVTGQLDASPLRPITVEDSVRTRRVVDQEVRISPDGSRVAYVVKSPDLVTNRNNYQLYILDLKRFGVRQNGRLLLQADRISAIRWIGSEQIVALVAIRSKGAESLRSQVRILNATTGAEDRLAYPGGIQEYSASVDGSTIVFSVKAPGDKGSRAADLVKQKEREERGYAVAFGEGTAGSIDHPPEDDIYLAKRTKAGSFDVRRLRFNEEGHSVYRSSLRDVQDLNLSPDGRYLLFVYNAESIPEGWAEQPYVQHMQNLGTSFHRYVLALYTLDTARLRLGFNFPGALLHTSWSYDSRCYSVVGPSPFGTRDADTESEAAVTSGDMEHFMGRFQHIFTIDPRSRVTTKVLDRENGELWEGVPLCWKHGEGPMLIRTGKSTFAWMAMQKGRWSENAQFSFSKNQSFLSSLNSDGEVLVGVSQNTMTPPDIIAFSLRTKEATLLTDLNPEYRDIELGQVERIAWHNRYGSKCAGFLIKPVGYEDGKRYPMVFLSAPPRDVFISDAPYTTAYAPQSLANAGFVVVISQYPLDNRVPEAEFPGEMKNAYNWMSMVESAVDMLVGRGMADANSVGLGGFSRTSWLTDFTLTHSSYNFKAASSADSGIYTYGTYFAYNSLGEIRASETQVGGPPYGDTFGHWLEYAPPFNAEKVRAAVLMEYIGTAEHGFEFFTALSRLGKAVELYRYPEGEHPLDTPLERVASLQRNVDWFRFWIEGYEGKAPIYDTAQYARWRALRLRTEAAQNVTAQLPF